MPAGVVGLARVAGVLIAGGQHHQGVPARVQPHPEGAAARGPQQMLGDRAAHLIQRWGGRRRGTPAVLAGTWRGNRSGLRAW